MLISVSRSFIEETNFYRESLQDTGSKELARAQTCSWMGMDVAEMDKFEALLRCKDNLRYAYLDTIYTAPVRKSFKHAKYYAGHGVLQGQKTPEGAKIIEIATIDAPCNHQTETLSQLMAAQRQDVYSTTEISVSMRDYEPSSLDFN